MHIIIPARYHSTRLPAKPLADIAGKSLIERVYDCARASGIASITIATDDERIARAARNFGARACLTASNHRSGTDRIGEAIAELGLGADEIVVNLQGDEPLMPPDVIRRTGQILDQRPGAVMATACHPIHDRETFDNPNVVKVVRDENGDALYFSRAPIPWPRTAPAPETSLGWRHIGIYAYRAGFVARYCAWPPCPPEEAEQLEQLRVLWHGERIAVIEVADAPPGGVDTPEDLERVRRYFMNRVIN